MASLTPAQLAWRERAETAIGLAAPFLDLVLAAGERLARVLEPDDDWVRPVHPPQRPPESG